jgi:hypothetical protein
LHSYMTELQKHVYSHFLDLSLWISPRHFKPACPKLNS